MQRVMLQVAVAAAMAIGGALTGTAADAGTPPPETCQMFVTTDTVNPADTATGIPDANIVLAIQRAACTQGDQTYKRWRVVVHQGGAGGTRDIDVRLNTSEPDAAATGTTCPARKIVAGEWHPPQIPDSTWFSPGFRFDAKVNGPFVWGWIHVTYQTGAEDLGETDTCQRWA